MNTSKTTLRTTTKSARTTLTTSVSSKSTMTTWWRKEWIYWPLDEKMTLTSIEMTTTVPKNKKKGGFLKGFIEYSAKRKATRRTDRRDQPGLKSSSSSFLQHTAGDDRTTKVWNNRQSALMQRFSMRLDLAGWHRAKCYSTISYSVKNRGQIFILSSIYAIINRFGRKTE